ncbi:unnamed protein product [Paramecium sonneborni]|uniref:Uncharacterized protein n=1 Tax=Paramecium sonneborni TaxID=65129 RepID=A0A8S1RGX4_9CILI|nr:unnamed protein product [Paramecium sonneborni]
MENQKQVLVLKLNYGNSLQILPLHISDLTITSSFNFQKQWRYYSFTILGTELSTRLVLDSQNTEQFVYKGYYSIAYYIANTDQLQYTLYFQFTVTVLRSNGAAVDTSFKPISQKESVGCTPNLPCVITAATTLKWCTDLKCTAYETPDLHLNDQFVLQQIVTTAGLTNYYLTGTEVWYTGGGLNKKATLEQVINTTPGQAIIQLKAEIAWRAVTIRVTSVLANASSGRRLLVQSTYDTVNGQTEQIECIKAKGSETCATCEQECQANGFARDGCEECSFSQQIAFVFLALLLALTF